MKDCYSVATYSVQSILGPTESGDIAIPEIQRPFVWNGTKVRDLVDSLYHGYPTGYLMSRRVFLPSARRHHQRETLFWRYLR